jgi:hypothetical protein
MGHIVYAVAPPGEPLLIIITPVSIPDGVPSYLEVQDTACNLSNGRSGGALMICTKHIKQWLQRIRREEDPKQSKGNHGAGNSWCLLMKLDTPVWETGTVPQQIGWIIVVLILKGSGDYHGISLLEPIWKIIERVMDRQLNAVELNSS